MAWTTPRCWTTGEVVTAAIMNTHVKANFDVTAPAVLTTAGDILYASGANAPARLAKGSNGNIIHQASCAPAWTASPSITGITLSGALDANGSIDFDGTTLAACASGAITLTSTSTSANGVYLRANGGTSETVKIHSDQGTSVTEGAASVSLLSDAGGVELRSTANLANAINITNDGGTTGTITIFNDQGTSVTEGAASIELLSDAGGVELRSTANLANAIALTSDGGTTGSILIFNDQGTTATEGSSSIQLLSDVGAVGIKSGLNAAGAIRLTADAGTSETIVIHADQGSGAASICLTSDAGGITMTASSAVTVTAPLTVGVDDTGHDVKFFGAGAGAYLEWDESANMLEVRGATAAGPGHLKLTTGEATVVACDVLGKIEFQAPAECGTDAITIAARIAAIAQGTFSATVNATDLVFYTGHSECAAEKIRFTSQGEIGIGGANYGTDGQVLTSGGAGAAVAWEDAAGGGGGASAVQVNDNVAFAVGTGSDSKIYYDGTDTHWDLRDTGTGALMIALGACHPSPDGNAVHIWEGTAGSVTARSAAMLILESCTCDEITLQFLMPGGGTAQQAIMFGDAADVTEGAIIYDHPDRNMRFATKGSQSLTIDGDQVLHNNGCASTPSISFRCDTNLGMYRVGTDKLGMSAVSTQLIQGTDDGEILAFKSSDVAHGVTSFTDTCTYANFKKLDGARGGLFICTAVESGSARSFLVRGTTGDSGSSLKSTSGLGVLYFEFGKTSGTGAGAMVANTNGVAMSEAGTTRWILCEDGDVYYDGSTNASNWDEFCDVQLLTATRAVLMRDGADFKNRFGGFISDYSCILEQTGVVALNRDTDSVPFVSTKGLNGLIIDSIRQVHETVLDTRNELADLQNRFKALEGGK
jgi:hypothetical protein